MINENLHYKARLRCFASGSSQELRGYNHGYFCSTDGPVVIAEGSLSARLMLTTVQIEFRLAPALLLSILPLLEPFPFG